MRSVLRRRLRTVTAVAMIGWTAALALSLTWELSLHRRETVALARSEARAAFEKDVTIRAWTARLGGVYVRADARGEEGVPPNPWLDVEHRDLETPAGTLTLVNPAYMTRMVHELGADRTGIVGHITSLNPIRPRNAPDPWERGALQAFEEGAEEVSEVQRIGGAEYLRLMRPLHVEQACLGCHADQGYRLGDVRGGISASVPMAPIAAIIAPSRTLSIAGHAVIWLVGMAGIAFGSRAMARLMTSLDGAHESAEAARTQAEQASRAKSEFLATMSHELRTPLNAILGFSEIIRDQAYGAGAGGKYREYAGDIHGSGRHLLALINDILDISKIEAGKTEIAPEPLDLAEELAGCRRLVQERADRKGLEVAVTGADGVVLWADRRALKQVMFNLLSNAIKFTPPGGRITMTAAAGADGGVAVMVSDTGCGMPEAEIDRLTRPFEQCSNAYVKRTAADGEADGEADGGTGLGLAVVKALVELHGGTLSIASRPDQGTAATLAFPAPPAEAAEAGSAGREDGAAPVGAAGPARAPARQPDRVPSRAAAPGSDPLRAA